MSTSPHRRFTSPAIREIVDNFADACSESLMACTPCTPAGVRAISRGLSAATPPEEHHWVRSDPGGVAASFHVSPALISEPTTSKLAPLPGCQANQHVNRGVVPASPGLNPRLIAVTPSGSNRWPHPYVLRRTKHRLLAKRPINRYYGRTHSAASSHLSPALQSASHSSRPSRHRKTIPTTTKARSYRPHELPSPSRRP